MLTVSIWAAAEAEPDSIKPAVSPKTNKHRRRRGSSEDETDVACSVPSAIYQEERGEHPLNFPGRCPAL
ncbi:MAG: hypothetical protein D3922_06175 [Candidatus Electrothrix sp. AR1]|nr:hypothetical protein [Candidatus Electrothrix sp. AR1]